MTRQVPCGLEVRGRDGIKRLPIEDICFQKVAGNPKCLIRL
jgi:hypothetical protein